MALIAAAVAAAVVEVVVVVVVLVVVVVIVVVVVMVAVDKLNLFDKQTHSFTHWPPPFMLSICASTN